MRSHIFSLFLYSTFNQGIVRKRMVQDKDDLPRQRTPSLGLGAAAYTNQPPAQEHTSERPPRLNKPQSAPPNPLQALPKELANLIHQIPPPPILVTDAPSATSNYEKTVESYSHPHRPTPEQRQQRGSQTSGMDHSLQQLQQQVPASFRTGIIG